MPGHGLTFMTFHTDNGAVGMAQEHVILLHGLCRTPRSMAAIERALVRAGYSVSNVGYPSRTASIAELSENAIGPAVEQRQRDGTIHFVTHSMGGILVRSFLSRHSVPALGRVVMLGPPNQGSEVVDKLGRWRIFGALNGPAGRELGTDSLSTPNRLGPVTFCLGVIAARRSINWINSFFLLPRPNDGKVSVERTKVSGMADHIVLPATHSFMMNNPSVIRQTIHFLRTGRFEALSQTSASSTSKTGQSEPIKHQ
jgi:triacylglycerol lipase